MLSLFGQRFTPIYVADSYGAADGQLKFIETHIQPV